jgi:hypothetical protein
MTCAKLAKAYVEEFQHSPDRVEYVLEGAVSKHISSDNRFSRFSAWADPPERGGVVADLATRGGQFSTLYDPPGGPGRGGADP